MSRACEFEGSCPAERQRLFYRDKPLHTLNQPDRKGEDAAQWQSAS